MKNIIFLTGYYGSGKTEIAINLALQKRFNYLVDLDIINPYFRSREAKHILKDVTEIISSDLKDDTYTDLPFISSKIYKPFHIENVTAIYDLGGNDLGAKVMRQFDIEQNFDFYLIVNIYRYETNDIKKIEKLINDIELSSGYKITGLVNNSNLLDETSYEHILTGESVIELVSEQVKIPIVLTCIHENVYDEHIEVKGEVLKLKTYLRKDWY